MEAMEMEGEVKTKVKAEATKAKAKEKTAKAEAEENLSFLKRKLEIIIKTREIKAKIINKAKTTFVSP